MKADKFWHVSTLKRQFLTHHLRVSPKILVYGQAVTLPKHYRKWIANAQVTYLIMVLRRECSKMRRLGGFAVTGDNDITESVAFTLCFSEVEDVEARRARPTAALDLGFTA